MVSGPTDLPGRRDFSDTGFVFESEPAFDSALAELQPDERARVYFRRDALEFRVNRHWELTLITGDPDLLWNGYLITENGAADMPACIVWFKIDEAARRCRFESIELTAATTEEEDET